jgi:Ca2+-binding EF-hand superfamily protein
MKSSKYSPTSLTKHGGMRGLSQSGSGVEIIFRFEVVLDEYGFVSGPASDDEWGQFNDTVSFATNITSLIQVQLEEAIAAGDWTTALTQAATDLAVDDDSASSSLYTTLSSTIGTNANNMIVYVVSWIRPFPEPTPSPTISLMPSEAPTPVPSEDPKYVDNNTGPLLTSASLGLGFLLIGICAGLTLKAAYRSKKKHSPKESKVDKEKERLGQSNLVELFGAKPLIKTDIIKEDPRRAIVRAANLEGFTDRMIDALFEGLDHDGDGYIDRIDLETWCKDAGSPLEENEVLALLMGYGVLRTPEMWIARRDRENWLEAERIRLKKLEDEARLAEAKAALARVKPTRTAGKGKGGKGVRGNPIAPRGRNIARKPVQPNRRVSRTTKPIERKRTPPPPRGKARASAITLSSNKEEAARQLEKGIQESLTRLKINPVMFYNISNKEKKKFITKKEIAVGLHQLTKLDITDEVMVDVMKCLDPKNEQKLTLKTIKLNFKKLLEISKLHEKPKPKPKPPPPKKNFEELSKLAQEAEELRKQEEEDAKVVIMLKEAEESRLQRIEEERIAQKIAAEKAANLVSETSKKVMVLTPDSVREMLSRYPQLAFHWEDALESSCNPVVGTVQHFSRKMNNFLFKHLDTDDDGFIKPKDVYCWSKMLRIGRPTTEFVDAIMAADQKGVGVVTEAELFFLLRENLMLAAELDAQCRVLQFILEPPTELIDINFSKFVTPIETLSSSNGGGVKSEEDTRYGNDLVTLMNRNLINPETGVPLLKDPFKDGFDNVMNTVELEVEHIDVRNMDKDDDDMLPLHNSTSSPMNRKTIEGLAMNTTPGGDAQSDAMFGESNQVTAYVNDIPLQQTSSFQLTHHDSSSSFRVGNPYAQQDEKHYIQHKRKLLEEADILIFRALAKILLNRSLVAHKQLLAFQYNIAVDIFNVLDTHHVGIIDFFDVQKFLRTHCHVSVSEDDLTFLKMYSAPNVRNLLLEEFKIVDETSNFNKKKFFKAQSMHDLLPGEVEVEEEDEETVEKFLKEKRSTQLDPEELQALLDAPAHSNLQRLLHQAALHYREQLIEAEWEAEGVTTVNGDSELMASINEAIRGSMDSDSGKLLQAAKSNAAELRRKASIAGDFIDPTGSFSLDRDKSSPPPSSANHGSAKEPVLLGGKRRRRSLDPNVVVKKHSKFDDPPPESHEPWPQRDVQLFFHLLDTDHDGCISAKDLALWLRTMLGPDESTINRRDVQALFHPNAPKFIPPIKKKKATQRGSMNVPARRRSSAGSGGGSFDEGNGSEPNSPKLKPYGQPLLSRHASKNTLKIKTSSGRLVKESSASNLFNRQSSDDLNRDSMDEDWHTAISAGKPGSPRAPRSTSPRPGSSQRPASNQRRGSLSRVLSAQNLFGGGGNNAESDSESEYEDEIPDNQDGYSSALRLDGMTEEGLLNERGLGMALARRPYLASQIRLLFKSFMRRVEAEDVREHFEPQVANALETLKDLLDVAVKAQKEQSATGDAVLIDRYGYLTDRELGTLVRRRRQQYNYAAVAARRHLEVLLHLEVGIKVHFLAEREMSLFPKKVEAARALGAFRAPAKVARIREQKRLSAFQAAAAKMSHLPQKMPGIGWDSAKVFDDMNKTASLNEDGEEEEKKKNDEDAEDKSGIKGIELGPMRLGKKGRSSMSKIWGNPDDEDDEKTAEEKELAKEAIEDVSKMSDLADFLEFAANADSNKNDDEDGGGDEEEKKTPSKMRKPSPKPKPKPSSPRVKTSLSKAWSFQSSVSTDFDTADNNKSFKSQESASSVDDSFREPPAISDAFGGDELEGLSGAMADVMKMRGTKKVPKRKSSFTKLDSKTSSSSDSSDESSVSLSTTTSDSDSSSDSSDSSDDEGKDKKTPSSKPPDIGRVESVGGEDMLLALASHKKQDSNASMTSEKPHHHHHHDKKKPLKRGLTREESAAGEDMLLAMVGGGDEDNNEEEPNTPVLKKKPSGNLKKPPSVRKNDSLKSPSSDSEADNPKQENSRSRKIATPPGPRLVRNSSGSLPPSPRPPSPGLVPAAKSKSPSPRPNKGGGRARMPSPKQRSPKPDTTATPTEQTAPAAESSSEVDIKEPSTQAAPETEVAVEAPAAPAVPEDEAPSTDERPSETDTPIAAADGGGGKGRRKGSRGGRGKGKGVEAPAVPTDEVLPIDERPSETTAGADDDGGKGRGKGGRGGRGKGKGGRGTPKARKKSPTPPPPSQLHAEANETSL